MSTMEDALVEWLTQVWNAQEKAAVPNCVYISGGYPAPSVPNCVGRLRPAGVTGCGWYLEGVVGQKNQLPAWWPARIHAHNLTHTTDDEKFTLARIASERAIVTRLVDLIAEQQERWENYCAWLDGRASVERPAWRFTEDEITAIPGLQLAVRHLATAYAAVGRLGYREEWRP